MSDSGWSKFMNFGDLINMIRSTNLMITFNARITLLLTSLLSVIDELADDHLVYKIERFEDILNAIRNTDLLTAFFSRIETLCSNILNAIKNKRDSREIIRSFKLIMRAIRDTDLIITFDSQIKGLFTTVLKAVEDIEMISKKKYLKTYLRLFRTLIC